MHRAVVFCCIAGSLGSVACRPTGDESPIFTGGDVTKTGKLGEANGPEWSLSSLEILSNSEQKEDEAILFKGNWDAVRSDVSPRIGDQQNLAVTVSGSELSYDGQNFPYEPLGGAGSITTDCIVPLFAVPKRKGELIMRLTINELFVALKEQGKLDLSKEVEIQKISGKNGAPATDLSADPIVLGASLQAPFAVKLEKGTEEKIRKKQGDYCKGVLSYADDLDESISGAQKLFLRLTLFAKKNAGSSGGAVAEHTTEVFETEKKKESLCPDKNEPDEKDLLAALANQRKDDAPTREQVVLFVDVKAGEVDLDEATFILPYADIVRACRSQHGNPDHDTTYKIIGVSGLTFPPKKGELPPANSPLEFVCPRLQAN